MKTTRRRILVKITSEQLHKRNHIKLPDGKELEIVDNINPNNWSVEEAEIYSVPDGHTFFEKGDRVLIDFSVVTAGMYPEMQLTSVTRIVEKNEYYAIMWCYCGADESSTTEIHAKIVEQDGKETLIPYPDTLIISQPEKAEAFKQNGLLFVPSEATESREKTFKAQVLFSGIKGVFGGDWVWIMGGHSVPIDSQNWKVEYVGVDGVLAIAS